MGIRSATFVRVTWSFRTPKREAHLTAVLNGLFGVKLGKDEIYVEASVEDFPQKKHNLLQAILAINDMFVMAEEHVLTLFKEDVALFLETRHIPAFSDFKLSGKSGLDHKFDFGIPKTTGKPERILQTINNLSKDNATSLAFAVADIRAIRPEPLGALAVINDSIRSPNDGHLAALRAYDVEPLHLVRPRRFCITSERWSAVNVSLSIVCLTGVTATLKPPFYSGQRI